MFDELKRTFEIRRRLSALTGGRRIVVVSNRGPVEHRENGNGSARAMRGAGGLVSALASLERMGPLTWLAAPATEADRRIALGLATTVGPAGSMGGNLRLRFVPLDPEVQQLHYGVVSNPVLWFLQHDMLSELRRPDLPRELRPAWREGYARANAEFAHAVIRELRRPDTAPVVLFQDYHLYLAPAQVRRAVPNAVLHHFIHVPWPGPATWRDFPWAYGTAICESLLANDVVRFQTPADARNFLDTCLEMVWNADVDVDGGVVRFAGRQTRVKASPVSVDVARLRLVADSPEVRRHRQRLAALAPGRLIVRVDRLDPTKNILAGLEAFDRLLTTHRGEMDDVTMLAFLVPTRTGIEEYDEHTARVLSMVEAVNRRHSRGGAPRIHLFHEHNFEQALAGMTLYDVLLVNPRADGMNLVSKEGPVVNRRDGVLVLSRAAGSWQELAGAALGVEPGDVAGTADAMARALTMSATERSLRAERLRGIIRARDLTRWVEEQADDLASLLAERRAPAPVARRALALDAAGL